MHQTSFSSAPNLADLHRATYKAAMSNVEMDCLTPGQTKSDIYNTRYHLQEVHHLATPARPTW